ncbi:hypothetical protein JCM21714_3204 [Gracilibacillus boraciitolerans JCM 21714]|uniref:DUF4064 domain-containing protein n=1 Tax=Gracilibacillus boraciitolerans JCM 21714 TaxID=1298598 RepID=W4VLI9_9BACI|nr:hypothetical protein [Gracilibacillus boraciitolerans]GAE94072.1 hypothetical protein JCM21714_3204 [Gracilibacillus boraciitolerans JCM 21714]
MKIWVAVLSVLGGLSGLVSGFMVTAGGEMFGDATMSNDGAAVFWLSALAIFLGFLSWKWNKPSGAGLIIIALYGIYANGLFFTIAFIFLLIAGILAFRIQPKEKQRAK